MQYGFRYPIPQSGDASLEIARNTHEKLLHFNKFGENSDVDTGERDIWPSPLTWVPPTVAQLHTLESDETTDTILGTGMRTVMVEGQDSGGFPQAEEVTLSGTTPVDTVNTYSIVTRIYGSSWGANGWNDGEILCKAKTDNVPMAFIIVDSGLGHGLNQSTQTPFKVPIDCNGYITQWSGGVIRGSATTVTLYLWRKPAGFTAWRLQGMLVANSAGNSSPSRAFNPPLKLGPGDCIKVSALSSANNTGVKAEYDIIFEIIA